MFHGPQPRNYVKMTMLKNQSGQLAVSALIALFAGASGSLLTLGVTSSLDDPEGSAYEAASTATEDANPTGNGLNDPTITGDSSDIDSGFGFEAASVSELAQTVEEAAGERAQFAKIISQLTLQIETLEADLVNINARLALNGPAPEKEEVKVEEEQSPRSGRTGEGRIEALIAAGIDPLYAEAFQTELDQYQLARLELIDQAEREGRRGADEFAQELDAFEDQRPRLRDEIGDDAFDRYLHEAGRNNRVIVRSIISGSAADLAGLRAGDTFISYGGERVFFVNQLQRETREGVRGESMPVVIERAGQRLRFEIPRGPLGITLGRSKQGPL